MSILTTSLLVLLVGLAVAGARMYRLLGPWVRPRAPLVPLRTPWAANLDVEAPLPGYPRPQLCRDRWLNLNGRWQFALAPQDAGRPASFEEEIIVPFPVESALSGVQRPVSPGERAWYRRTFESPAKPGERLLLHFGAVDYEACVWVNGNSIGRHQGGFTPFSFDVTEALVDAGPQELVVAVSDPTDTGGQARGKQTLEPKAIWYTAVTGIWQTVWLEPVSACRVERVWTTTDLDASAVTLAAELAGVEPGDSLAVEIRADGNPVASAILEVDAAQVAHTFPLAGLRRWSPDDPFLYDVRLSVRRGEVEVDRSASYFGAREISTARDADGHWRMVLNGEPLFHLGLLDQGWWPDGLYTAPTDEALVFDIEATRRMGFNTIRKHVKVEPARWYWHADRLGVLVWQDMPTSGRGAMHSMVKEIWWTARKTPHEERGYDLTRTPEEARGFRAELGAMIDSLESFASIVVWVPFNEAWGQFDTDVVLAEVASRDPSRLVDGPSGWLDTGSGQLRDHHVYFGISRMPQLEPDRPMVYGEFGGLAHEVQGHLGVERGFGYQVFAEREAMEKAYTSLVGKIRQLAQRGLAGAIYTQTTDVEGEINGLLTYDRVVFKIAPERLRELHRPLIEGPGREEAPR